MKPVSPRWVRLKEILTLLLLTWFSARSVKLYVSCESWVSCQVHQFLCSQTFFFPENLKNKQTKNNNFRVYTFVNTDVYPCPLSGFKTMFHTTASIHHQQTLKWRCFDKFNLCNDKSLTPCCRWWELSLIYSGYGKKLEMMKLLLKHMKLFSHQD